MLTYARNRERPLRRRYRRVIKAVALFAFAPVLLAPGSQHVAQYLPLIGSDNKAAPFTRQCPSDQVLTGIRARLGRVIDAIGIKCRAVNANGSLGGENDVGTLAGGSSGVLGAGSCPAGSVIVGQAGSAADPAGVSLLNLRCRRWDPMTRVWGGATTAVIQLITGAEAGVVVGTVSREGANNSTDCSRQSQPAILIRGRAGQIIDAAGLTCDEP